MNFIRCAHDLARPLQIFVVLALALTFSPAAHGGSTPRLLFEIAGDKVYTTAADDARVLRQQTLIVDFEGLNQKLEAGKTTKFAIELFDGRHILTVERIEETLAGPAMVARVDGEKEGMAVFAWGEGTLTGDVFLPTAHYRIRPLDGVQVLELLDLSAHPVDSDHSLDSASLGAGALALPLPVVAANSPVFKDSGDIFDLLVVYSPAARAAIGGEAAMQQRIAVGIAETNQIFAASGIVPRVRLVGAQQIAYTELGTDIGNELVAIAQTLDGRGDEVHALRDSLAADLVMLIGENTNGGCGIAFIMPGSNNSGFDYKAFSYVGRSCLGGGFVFTHELSHNLGCNHAPNDPGKPGAYSFSYAYKNPSGLFRTLMAYSCGAGACTMLPRFSNPRQTHLGQPIGNSAQDNARSINGVRNVVANFRTSTPLPPPDDPGRIELASAGLAVDEEQGTLQLRVRRVAGSDGAVAVNWRTVDSTARSGSDYLAGSGQLEWDDGDSADKIITITLLDDDIDEGEETFRVVLSAVTGGADLGNAQTIVRLLGRDFQPFDCVPDASTLCLLDGRFQVRVDWRDFESNTGAGQVVAGAQTVNSGMFWFFAEENWELLLKILDGCGLNQRYWVLSAATTNVAYTVHIVDSQTGIEQTYSNPLGTSADAVTDTSAFATCL